MAFDWILIHQESQAEKNAFQQALPYEVPYGRYYCVQGSLKFFPDHFYLGSYLAPTLSWGRPRDPGMIDDRWSMGPPRAEGTANIVEIDAAARNSEERHQDKSKVPTYVSSNCSSSR